MKIVRAGNRYTRASRPLNAFLLVVLLLACSVQAAHAGGEQDVEHATMAPLAARSLLLGVTSAGDALVAVGERGHILRSFDNGGTWVQVDVPTTATLTAVDFLDAQLGIAVGHDAVILRTRDGGTSWERVHSDPDLESPLLDVLILGPERILAVGAYGLALESRDGGDTWERAVVSDTDSHLNQLSRAADGTLYIAAEQGSAFRSEDDGDTWEELNAPYDGSLFGVTPLSGDSLLLFGLRGHLFRSDDKGETWTTVDTGTLAMLTDGIDLGEGRVVVVGLVGVVLVSGDAGRTLTFWPQANRLGIQAVARAPDGALVVVGEFGATRVELQRPTPGGGE